MSGLSFVLWIVPMFSMGDAPHESLPQKSEVPSDDFSEAEAAEKSGVWLLAYERYRSSFEQSPYKLAARDGMLRTLRHLDAEARRLDPEYRSYVQRLTSKDALDLYVEVLEKLHAHHMDHNKTNAALLFEFGKQECSQALSDTVFIQRFLPGQSPHRVTEFRAMIQARNFQVQTAKQARDALLDVGREANRAFGVNITSAIIMEFLCGACRRVDDYSAFLYPNKHQEQENNQERRSVVDAQILPNRPGIGYLKIAHFHESTPRELDDSLQSLGMLGMRGLILDLRGNSGGNLSAAIETACRFQGHGLIATTKAHLPEFAERSFSSDRGRDAYDMPMVVLVDRRTMSAAEVVVAAWKSSGRALIVGMNTFGKGIVQSPPIPLQTANRVPTPKSSGTLVISIAEVFAPNKLAIDRAGVAPHTIESDPILQLELAVNKLQEQLDALRKVDG